MLATEPGTILEEYRKQIHSYDEILMTDGSLKAGWQKLFDNIRKLSIQEIRLRHQEIIRQLKENGVTYNVYGDPKGLNRAWEIDPIPFLIEQKEWEEISRGFIQRSYLLNLILKDLYGERKLIRKGIIPAELIFGHGGFLRPCDKLILPGNKNLIIHASDMARGPDGRMWVLNDRTQSPSGIGYTLENRTVLNRFLPELFQGIHPKSLSGFFFNLQQAVIEILPQPKEDPFIVYLTPGPNNETYFEHTYLASYLGYSLVQGNDLVVRDGYVWMKTLEGLQKVDVIIRRIDDLYCDPVELKDDSQLGIPGLLQVMRQGNVTVINPPGCSILENTGLFSFMQAAASYFLSEDLLLPSVATWWCGQSKELAYVLDNMDKLIIKHIDRGVGFTRKYGARLSKKQQDELKAIIKSKPYLFVGQEDVSFSATPSLVGETIEPRLAAFRCYSVADKAGYHLMPGGLTRRSRGKDIFSVSNSYGGISKDTWIISDNPDQDVFAKPFSNKFPDKVITLTSRSGENLFWVGRMAERTLAISRFIDIVLSNLNDLSSDSASSSRIAILLQALTHLTASYPGFTGEEGKLIQKEPLPEIFDLSVNNNRQGSVTNNLELMIHATIAVRERLSMDSWKVVGLIEETLQKLKSLGKSRSSSLQKSLNVLNLRLFTFYGVLSETMPQHGGWHLLEIGKMIERCLNSISVIRSILGNVHKEPTEHGLYESILLYQHSLSNYRLRYRSLYHPETIIDTLLFSSVLPYSLISLLGEIEKHVNALPIKAPAGRLNKGQKILVRASGILKLGDAKEFAQSEVGSGYRKKLDESLNELQTHILELSVVLSNMYFSHTFQQHTFSEFSSEQVL